MFSRNKNNKNNKNQQTSQVRMVPSIISIDLVVSGDLESAGEVQVDGNVLGDIRAKVLLVGESAKITGEIFAETVRVHGNVNGQITAKFVNLAKTAHVVGDIHHENLSIQEGAFLEGHMVHISEKESQSLAPAEVVETLPAPAPAKPVKAVSNANKPDEDRVNLVVKTGRQGGDPKQVPTPPLNPPSSSGRDGKALSGK